MTQKGKAKAEAILYHEEPSVGNPHRAQMLREVKALIRRERRQADKRRKAFFQPDMTSACAYENSLEGYRERLREMLGWPLTEPYKGTRPKAKLKRIAEDDLGTIDRVHIEALPGVHAYGLFFKPKGKGPFPFALVQHGGQGTPEVCSGFFDSSNYNDMTRRVLRRGIAVFAPQLILWNTERFGPNHEKEVLDRNLKQVGGSLAAFEVYRLQRCLDYFAGRKDIDAGRMGMIGLSYGGFYTLMTTALDTRLRVAVSSCFVNDRYRYDFTDWVWKGSANQFMDAELASMVCPRPLYIELGKRDDLFDIRYARAEVEKIHATYQQLKLSGKMKYREHPGGHELDLSDGGIRFLEKHLKD